MSDAGQHRLDAAAITALFRREFPQALAMTIEHAEPGFARVRRDVATADLRPGGTISGPTLMALADMATYVALLAAVGAELLAVTTHLGIDFLRKPAAGRALVAEARLLKLGRRLAVAEVSIVSEGSDDLVARASVTYSIPPPERR